MDGTVSDGSKSARTKKDHPAPPVKPDQEWANALTHGIACLGTICLGSYMVWMALPDGNGITIACLVYATSVFATFGFSTLSHIVRRQPMLNTMRAWDQAMIYAMISGTYTPIAYRYATESTQVALLAAIWVAATIGIVGKLLFQHRINSIGTISYLLLGWLPAIPLAGHVPRDLAWWMVAGGVLYTVGVVFLMNDSKLRYLHAVWHLAVMAAAVAHFVGIMHYVVGT
ncbi:MAG: hemolysin III family protein [Rubripirellula sp.]|nr:hemolysin III family protein [Rubripirellula sp.]